MYFQEIYTLSSDQLLTVMIYGKIPSTRVTYGFSYHERMSKFLSVVIHELTGIGLYVGGTVA